MIRLRKLRVYVDTPVFGGVEDDEFMEESRRFFSHVQRGNYTVLLSDETLRELDLAPESVKAVWKSLEPGNVELVEIDDEVQQLSVAYIDERILEKTSEGDALHVAAATVADADVILSWNFKHIVNYDRIRGFNGVNLKHGYRALSIISPMELDADEQE